MHQLITKLPMLNPYPSIPLSI